MSRQQGHLAANDTQFRTSRRATFGGLARESLQHILRGTPKVHLHYLGGSIIEDQENSCVSGVDDNLGP